MKALMLSCFVLIAYPVGSCDKPRQGQKTEPRAESADRDALLQEEGACGECICENCGRPSERLPEVAPACPTVVKTKWDLWRSGTCLRGVNTWQKKVEQDDGEVVVNYTYSDKDLKPLRDLKANYVNLSFPGIYSVKPKDGEYVLEPRVLVELKELVDRLKEHKLFAVVSFRSGPGRSESVFGGEEGEEVVTDVWNKETDAARRAWVAMWKKTAEELRGKSNVVGYDLMVEPVGDREKVAEDTEEGKTENKRRYDLWYELSGLIAKEIRDAGDTTPILVGGANASPACSLACVPPINRPHIVYTVHQYEPYKYTHQVIEKDGGEQAQNSLYDCGDPNKRVPEPRYIKRPREAKEMLRQIYLLLDGFRRARGQAPVAVNEFGIFRWSPKASQHLGDEMEFLEMVGANHALWLWEPIACIGYDDFNFRHGTDFKKHDDVFSRNPLIKVIKTNWERNTVFADTVTFDPVSP